MTTLPLAQIERSFLRIGLFLLPLAFWWDTYDRYVLPKVLVARFLVLGLLAFYVARIVTTRTLVFKRTPLDLPWLAFAAVARSAGWGAGSESPYDLQRGHEDRRAARRPDRGGVTS